MDLEEIEEDYNQQIHKADLEFIKISSTGADLKNAESEYKELTKKVRKKYIERLTTFLEKSKNGNNKKINSKKEEYARFTVDTSSYDIGFIEKIKIKLDLLFFNFSFRLKNMLKAHIPDWALFRYFSAKLIFMHIYWNIDEKLSYVEEIFSNVVSFIKEKTKKYI